MISPCSQLRGTATWATSSSSRRSRSPNTSVPARRRTVSSAVDMRRIIPPGVAVAPEEAVTFADVESASRALEGRVRETPLLSAGELSRRMGTRVLVKAENLQLTGSFKARGAAHMIRGLAREALDAGVVAASAGNHAQAVAFAARDAGARAVLVMPAQAPLAKLAAVRQYGGDVGLVGGGYHRG